MKVKTVNTLLKEFPLTMGQRQRNGVRSINTVIYHYIIF